MNQAEGYVPASKTGYLKALWRSPRWGLLPVQKIQKALASLTAMATSGLLLADCTACARFNGEFRFDRQVIEAALVASTLVFLLQLCESFLSLPNVAQRIALHLRQLLLLTVVVAFPVVMVTGASWGASPCPLCVLFWLSFGYLMVKEESLGNCRTALLAVTLLSAIGGTMAIRGSSYEAGARREFIQQAARNVGIVKLGDQWVPKVGDSVSAVAQRRWKDVVVASNCSFCLRRAMAGAWPSRRHLQPSSPFLRPLPRWLTSTAPGFHLRPLLSITSCGDSSMSSPTEHPTFLSLPAIASSRGFREIHPQSIYHC